MLRNNYSPELATGVIAASGTLGQIIPPSIVIVLLGTLAGDLYSAAQETRAQAAGCSDALTYLGEAAVLSVGTLFQAALLPGIMLAVLYGLYAFGFAMFNPSKAPPVPAEGKVNNYIITRRDGYLWFLIAPAGLIAGAVLFGMVGIAGSQSMQIDSFSARKDTSGLRTNVSAQCKESMIAFHGQEKWDEAVAMQAELQAAGGLQESRRRTPEELVAARAEKLANAAPIGTGVLTIAVILALILTTAAGVAPGERSRALQIGAGGIALMLLADILFISPMTSPGMTVLFLALPFLVVLYGCRQAAGLLSQNDLIRVVFPPLVLIVAVLGSILGGITNPTPAAALGAAGALMLAAYRKLHDEGRSGSMILIAAFSVVVMILAGINFDLRMSVSGVQTEQIVAFIVAQLTYSIAVIGLLYACWVLLRSRVLTPVVRETTKVTSMVFAILIGSQLLNLVVISFGGEHYIQTFLRSFESEFAVFLIVMLVLFILGFVMDFLEIIYIVVPIVGPVIYGGTMDPSWVTIMITVNLQTSFLTPPFGFALFYLRGVAPDSVTTGHIYRGIIPFVGIQMAALGLLWMFPWVVTIVPSLIGN